MSKSKPSWEKLMKSGEKALQKQDFPLAMALFEKALTLSPDNAELYKWIGRVHGDQGNMEEAEKAYWLAIDKDSAYYPAYNNLGVIYKGKALYEQALQFFEQAHRINPESALPIYGIAQVYDEQNEIEKALSYFLSAREKDPDLWGIFIHLGYIYKEKGQFEQALAEFQQALSAYPKATQPYYGLAITYLKMGKLIEAEQHFQLALERATDGFEKHYYYIGNQYRKSEAYFECIPYFQKVLALNPKDDCSYYGLCCAYRRLKNYAKALHYGKKAIACNPWGWYNHYMLGLCFADLHIAKKAVPHLEKAFQIATEDQKASIGYLTCSWLLFFKDEPKLESHLQKFLALNVPNEASQYAAELLKLARYVLQFPREDISKRCLERILELAADEDSLCEAGRLFQKLQLTDQAEACFVKALALNPKSAEANRQLKQGTKAYRSLRKGLKQSSRSPGLTSGKFQPLDQDTNTHKSQKTRRYILHLLELNQQIKRGKP